MSSKVGNVTTGTEKAAKDVPVKGAKGTTSTPRKGLWGKVLRGKGYDERLRLEESLKLVVSNSVSPPSGACLVSSSFKAKTEISFLSLVLVNETSLALSSEYLWLSHLFPSETLDKVRLRIYI